MEINYLRVACSMTRWEDESNESMYKTSDMEPRANGVVWCGVVEWVK